MLAPPNQGSEVVDDFRNVPGFKAINGPAGMQLGTDTDGVIAALGPVEFSLGVIAGTRTFNPILSQSLPNPDDGKVSVESTKVEGMTDFVTVEHSHPFIMQAPAAINYAIAFIKDGSFGVESP
ncbi:MAG: alpha/beta hydrolase, partial [Pseudomonadota bacterium]